MEQNLKDSQSEASQLKDKLSVATVELEATKTRLSRAQTDVKSLQSSQEEHEEANKRLREKLSRLEVGLLPLISPPRQETYQNPDWSSISTLSSGSAAVSHHGELGGRARAARRGESAEK